MKRVMLYWHKATDKNDISGFHWYDDEGAGTPVDVQMLGDPNPYKQGDHKALIVCDSHGWWNLTNVECCE